MSKIIIHLNDEMMRNPEQAKLIFKEIIKQATLIFGDVKIEVER